MNALIVATHNANKLREIGQILPGWDISGEDAGVVKEDMRRPVKAHDCAVYLAKVVNI